MPFFRESEGKGESMISLQSNVKLLSCIAALLGSTMAAFAAAPDVSYTAAGTFSNPAVSGADDLKLAGEPFTITIVASSASEPSKHGSNWGVYSPFKMTGEVHSGLIGSTPVDIASGAASIQLAIGPAYDIFITAFPVKVVGISLTIKATINLPVGTLANLYIHPFSAVALNPSITTISYSDGTNTTVLSVQSGSLTAVIATGSSSAQPSTAHWLPSDAFDPVALARFKIYLATPDRAASELS